MNSLPITGVHNKLKNSIVFFLFINSFLTSLSFLHYRNILGFSSSILVSLNVILLGMLWSLMWSFSSRYHDFDVELDGCGARCLTHGARYLERGWVSCTNRYSCSANPSRARLTRSIIIMRIHCINQNLAVGIQQQ